MGQQSSTASGQGLDRDREYADPDVECASDAIEMIAAADFNQNLIMIPAQEDSMAGHFGDVHLELWAHAMYGSNGSSATSASWRFSSR